MAAEAFVTLASTDAYALGALVLGSSLRKVETKKHLVVMITKTVSPSMRDVLKGVFDLVQEVDVLDSRDHMNLGLLSRPDLGVTFTKLHCWRLVQYTKAVFMDADTLVLQNVDDLFDREEFSASPDPGWPDCFNSGVFVFKPSIETYESILAFALSKGSFDGGDQGLLNMYFHDWSTKDISKHLPFVYNCVSQAFYSYLPAMAHFKTKIRVVHFIGPVKPWHHAVNEETSEVIPQPNTGFQTEYLQLWWNCFMSDIKSKLPKEIEGLAEQLSHLNTGEWKGAACAPPPHKTMDERERQYAWERGDIDYTGSDRFDNIMSKINTSIKEPEKPEKPETPAPTAKTPPPKE